MRVLCVAGLDPSGGAGLAADIRALGFLGIDAYPVASVLTVQNSREFVSFEPVKTIKIENQIDAAFGEEPPKAVKVGLLGNVDVIRMLSARLRRLPVVVDPVFRSSSGFELIDQSMLEAYEEALFPNTTVLTPNAHEAGVLAGMNVSDVESAKRSARIISESGVKAVLVKGGHFTDDKGTDVLYFENEFRILPGPVFPDHVRGTGCTYSSLIAGYLAKEYSIPDAVKMAKSNMRFFLMARPALNDEQTEVWQALDKAIDEIVHLLLPEMIAEVGNNVAFALKDAMGPEGLCSLDSRLILKAGRVITLGRPVFGRDSHVGRVVLAAMSHYPELRCAMNLRFSDDILVSATDAGLDMLQFDRKEEPPGESSMSWGTARALEEGRADIVFDRGSVGKEPMIRLLAKDPEDLISKLTLLVGKHS